MAIACSPTRNRKDLCLRGMDCPFPVSLSPSGSHSTLVAPLSCANGFVASERLFSPDIDAASASDVKLKPREAAAAADAATSPDAANEPLVLSGGEEIDAAAEAAAMAPVSLVRQKRRNRNRMSARFRTQPVTFEEIKEVDEEQQQQQQQQLQNQQQQQQQQQQQLSETNIESQRGNALTRSLDNLQHQKDFQTLVVDCSEIDAAKG